MRATLLIALTLAVSAAAAEETTVAKKSIWVDTVKRGNLPVMVRGLGVVTAPALADLTVPESHVKRLQPGQRVSLNLRPGDIGGAISTIGTSAADGLAPVTVRLDRPVPPGVEIGRQIDGTISITTLNDVVFLGRPVQAEADSDGALFKVDPDGRHATRVKVHYGQSSINRIEVRAGLAPGDRVILSDTAAFRNQERIRIQ